MIVYSDTFSYMAPAELNSEYGTRENADMAYSDKSVCLGVCLPLLKIAGVQLLINFEHTLV